MVGGLVLEHCLASANIGEVIVLTRRTTNHTNPKLKEIILNDFSDYSTLKEYFKEVDAAFFCLGAYTGQVTDDQFKEITVDYAVAFAKKIKECSPQARFCLLSGAGADRTEKSRTSFARYKGMAENQISALGLAFYTFRPGYIYPVQKRKEPNAMYKFSRFLYPLLKYMGKKYSIQSTELAQAMFIVGMNGASKEILENLDILNLID